jgi:hypothetical protein
MTRTPPHEPVGSRPTKAANLVAHGLVVRGMHGTHLVGPVSFTAEPGAVTLLTGTDPAARWAVAGAITGRLPMDRMRVGGTISMGGLTTPPLLRSESALAQSWRIRGVADAAERRLAALAWARSLSIHVIVLSPGLDGLDQAGRRLVLEDAARTAESGRIVVVTAPTNVAGSVERQLATVTITLPQGHRSQFAA